MAWNETSYNNPAFDKLLDEAGATVDVGERRKIMANIQKELRNDAVIGQTFWRAVFVAHSNRVKGLYAQVALENHYNKVWLS